jgi:cell division protein FtsW
MAYIGCHYFRAISKVALPVVWILLLYTLVKGTVIAGANASRWIQVPFRHVIPTSTLASVVLFIFVVRYLSKTRVAINFKSSLWELWLPVFITLVLILPANFSTTALIFAMILMLVFIGKYPLKYIELLSVLEFYFLLFLFLLPKLILAFSRVTTWESQLKISARINQMKMITKLRG